MPVSALLPKAHDPASRKPPAAIRQVRGTDTGEQAFAYAKACGIIGKSFVGKRISALVKINSLNELDRLLFPEISRELPGRELLADLERRILQRTTRHILGILDSYSRPPELLILQLRSCEYSDLKSCLRNIAAGKDIPVLLSDIGRFRTINFSAYPDIAAMLRGTEFEFILKKDLGAMKSADFDFTPLEMELDLFYYTRLAQSLQRLSADNSFIARQILADEISLRNCVWALRLRVYFQKKPAEAEKYIMELKVPPAAFESFSSSAIPGRIHPRTTESVSQSGGSGEISLSDEARTLLRFSLEDRSEWKGWRWESMLNPEKAGITWAADPRYFQNAASRYIYRMSLRGFRLTPFAISSVFCYIKLKQFEEDFLTSITEGLGLGMTSHDIFNLLEVPT